MIFLVVADEQPLCVLEGEPQPAVYEMSKITATPTDSVFRSAENSMARAVGLGKPPPETSQRWLA